MGRWIAGRPGGRQDLRLRRKAHVSNFATSSFGHLMTKGGSAICPSGFAIHLTLLLVNSRPATSDFFRNVVDGKTFVDQPPHLRTCSFVRIISPGQIGVLLNKNMTRTDGPPTVIETVERVAAILK